MVDLAKFLVDPETNVREVIACIDRNHSGIALVVDGERRLMGTITDGDIRRAILAGISLDLTAEALLARKVLGTGHQPITSLVGTTDGELLRLMNKHSIRHIPLLDETGFVQDVALLTKLANEYDLPIKAIVMVGGYGSRMLPLTEKVPKPMLPLGDQPILQRIINQLRQSRIRRVVLATHYKADVISDHFGDGRDFGIEVSYINEDEPLGTAGALGLLDASDEPLLVINGDIVTQLDFAAMLDYHREQQAEMTVAVRKFEYRVPYGMVETDGVRVTSISEKPLVQHFVNAGIYLMNPEVCRDIPQGRRFDMPELISKLIASGRHVVGFPIYEFLLDIGQYDDYVEAQAAVKQGQPDLPQS